MTGYLRRAAAQLAQTINPTPVQTAQAQVGLRQCVVTTVNGDSSVFVSVGGSTPAGPLATLTSYTPVVGDVVMVLKNGPDWLVLGTVNRPTG